MTQTFFSFHPDNCTSANLVSRDLSLTVLKLNFFSLVRDFSSCTGRVFDYKYSDIRLITITSTRDYLLAKKQRKR